MLPRLGHGPVGRAHDQNGAVHLGGAGDHVLDVVGVARAVHMGVVAIGRFVFHVTDGNGHNLGGIASPLTLTGFGHFVVGDELRHALIGRHLGQRRGQRRLAVVHVPDRPDIHVRLPPLIFRLRHNCLRCLRKVKVQAKVEKTLSVSPLQP
ncbi:MAG: hypothetical protein EWM73_03016 [Nitrospira sp.]|nr:MAG: hypothetical protein EWM73_03016 [Nitrospira sp.]